MMPPIQRRDALVLALVGLALAAGLAIYTLAYSQGREYWPLMIDFRYLYTAGVSWQQGLSPYLETWNDVLPSIHGDLSPFAYPPNWWAPTLALAALPQWAAHVVWQVVCLASLSLTAWIIAHVTLRHRADFSSIGSRVADRVSAVWIAPVLVAAVLAYMLASKSAGTNAMLGQTGVLIALGQALLLAGVVWRRDALLTAGVVIMLLKPHVGIPYVALLLLPRSTRKPVLIGGVITVALMLPPMIMHGPVEVMQGMLDNMSVYGARPENSAVATSGIDNFVNRLTGVTLSPALLLGCSLVGALGGWLWLRARMRPELSEIALLTSVTLSVTVFVPLHDWDFGLIFPLIGFLFVLRGLALALGVGVAVALTRVTEMLEWTLSPGVWLGQQEVSATIFSMTACVCVAIAVIATRRALVKVTPET